MRRARRGRRSSSDLDATAEEFLAHVKANDGQRLEEIGRALKINTAELKRPAQMLLAAKVVRTTGAKRGTKYHAKGGGSTGVGGKRAKKA